MFGGGSTAKHSAAGSGKGKTQAVAKSGAKKGEPAAKTTAKGKLARKTQCFLRQSQGKGEGFQGQKNGHLRLGPLTQKIGSPGRRL